MERTLSRALAPQKGGRPRKQVPDATQELFDFAFTEGVEKRAVCPRISLSPDFPRPDFPPFSLSPLPHN